METQAHPESLIKGPAYAVIIGIREHKYGRDGDGQPLAPREFPNLLLSDKDADDFRDVLKTHVGFLEPNIAFLDNGNATLSNIRDSLEDVRKNCVSAGEANPLVIVYFAGHGWVDDEMRHFLVPWDAERDRLYRTGLRNRELRELLRELNTNRLVLFLDACHSGEIASSGSRGGPPRYDARTELGGGEGRHFLASCKPSQKSWEWKEKKNGIFTYHLNELLKGETDDITQEAITPGLLFNKLGTLVKATAKSLGKEQEPFGSSEGSSDDIVLAINKVARRKRLSSEQARRDCGRVLSERIKQKSSGFRTIVARRVDEFAQGQRVNDPQYDEFYQDLSGMFAVPRLDNDTLIDEWSDLLIRIYEEAVYTLAKEVKNQGQQVALPDQFVTRPSAARVQSSAQPTAVSPEAPQTRKQMSPDDRDFVVAALESSDMYSRESLILRNVLRQPVSQEGFESTIDRLAGSRPEDKSFLILLEDAKNRFQETWLHIETAKGSSIIIEKNKNG